MFVRDRIGGLCLVGLIFLGGYAPAWSAGICAENSQSVRFSEPLSHSRNELRMHHRLTVVAMGSSSTYGTGATSPSHTYPAVLQHDLAAALPGATIRVINRGVPGEDLFEMLPRLDRDVIAEHPDLVILQLGTNFVLKRLPIDKFLPALTVAINRVQQSGADIVLMDPQYAPRLAGWSEVDSVVREMNEVSERGHIDLISRYAMMKTWAKRGQFASGSMLSHDGLHMNDASYSCLGDTVASAVLDALQPAATAQMVSTEHPRGSAHSVKTPRLPAQHIIR